MNNIKKIAGVFTAALIILSCTNQANVPSSIKDAFAKDYPGISAKWNKEDSDYEANFQMNNQTMSALYSQDGNRKETEIEIKVNDLPLSAKDYIKSNYKDGKIKEAAKITKATGEVNYEAEVSGVDVLFTVNGDFIKTTKE